MADDIGVSVAGGVWSGFVVDGAGVAEAGFFEVSGVAGFVIAVGDVRVFVAVVGVGGVVADFVVCDVIVAGDEEGVGVEDFGAGVGMSAGADAGEDVGTGAGTDAGAGCTGFGVDTVGVAGGVAPAVVGFDAANSASIFFACSFPGSNSRISFRP